MCFSSPSKPQPQPLPAPIPDPPRMMDQTQLEARDRNDAQIRAMRGSASTVLALQGASDQQGVGAGAQLLGRTA